ncbi:hypothetical protein SAMN05444678_1268 [Sphingomonas sp. YR710]|uniref:hypothetical protein n=1 Tax=Sphingomonas sp. YR710 TaxID=1882773 RepID=UPI0008923F6C|nr:hypothetical protein [Sphingomonas sp. YR710]SDD84807.1 hypothetical protein SAMN05444678_1268 [Sphingomonas sp. YR710]
MLSLSDTGLMLEALTLPLEPELHRLLAEHIEHTIASGLGGMTHIIVIQPGDTESAIVEEIGMSPLVNPIDGIRYPSPAFHPGWDWLQRCEGWFIMIDTVADSGFAYVILIQDAEGVLPDLRRLCHAFA